MATRRARGLRPLLLNTEHAGSSNHDDSRLSSVDLDPAQREFLDMSSPYHDNFPTPSTPYDEQGHRIRRPSNNPFPSLLRNFSYRGLSSKLGFGSGSRSDAEKAHSNENEDDEGVDTDSDGPDAATDNGKHLQWAPDLAGPTADTESRWTPIPFLLLLLSALLNFFLLFNGPPNRIPIPQHSISNPLPHKAFHFQDRYEGYGGGRNYTCFEMKGRTLRENKEFVGLGGRYDFLWRELLGASRGWVYVDVKDAKQKSKEAMDVERRRLSMFHQLECLVGLRGALQAFREGQSYLHVDVDGVGDIYGDVDGYLGRCLDYLRQFALCRADDELEVARFKGGFSMRRECRDSSWLYDVTACGEGGCPGKPFYQGE